MTTHPALAMFQDGAFGLVPATDLDKGLVYIEMGSPRSPDFGNRAIAEAIVKRHDDGQIKRLERDRELSKIGFYMAPLEGLRFYQFYDEG